MGVEPTITAWEAVVLPLHYGRVSFLGRKRSAAPYSQLTTVILPQKTTNASPFSLRRAFFFKIFPNFPPPRLFFPLNARFAPRPLDAPR